MIHGNMLTVKLSQIKQYKELVRVFDITNYDYATKKKLLNGCYVVCVSRNTDRRINGFYAVNPKTSAHIVCFGKAAHALLSEFNIPEIIDLGY